MNEKMERFTINFEDITDEKTEFSFRVGQNQSRCSGEILNVEETLQIIDNLKPSKKK